MYERTEFAVTEYSGGVLRHSTGSITAREFLDGYGFRDYPASKGGGSPTFPQTFQLPSSGT
jgi:hypothetical protein